MKQRRRYRTGADLFSASDLPTLPRTTESFSPLLELEAEPALPALERFRVPLRFYSSLRVDDLERRRNRFPATRINFEYPRQVIDCVRRHSRREVLFARRVAGRRRRSPGRGGSYRRTHFSQYGC